MNSYKEIYISNLMNLIPRKVVYLQECFLKRGKMKILQYASKKQEWGGNIRPHY